MEIDITLDQLPEHILEVIFAFLPKNADLRLVCKTFKSVIDYSKMLMKNKWLKLDCPVNGSFKKNYHYQNFIIYDLCFEIFCWLHKYKHKNRIKAVDIKCTQIEVKESASVVQYILFNYKSLETIKFDTEEIDWKKSPAQRIRFIPNKKSNLKTLDVSSYSNHRDNGLKMCSKISSIKNLIISRYDILEFPTKNKWQLEELIIHELIDYEVNDDNFKLFLQNQPSLKKLIFKHTDGYAYLIMRYLPNLNHLKFQLEFDEEFDDSLLLKNSILKRLDIHHCYEVNNNVMKAFLDHYNGIEYLSIVFAGSSSTGNSISFSLNFEHLTHLALNAVQSFPLLNSHLPKIKILVMANYEDKKYDFSQISNENLKNVEKLCLDFSKLDDVIAVVQKCPRLIELNIKINKWLNLQSFISKINEILETAVNVKRLGLTEVYLLKMQYKELQSQISIKGISLKLHHNFNSMYADDWGRDNAKYIDI